VLLLNSDFVVVFCTAPPDSSGRLARLIVEERLAACVNISQVRSTFLWEGKVDEEAEDLLIIKTEDLLVNDIAARIRDVHPYELPEIVVLPIVGGDEGYLKWISESVRKSPGSKKLNSEDV
jgi:periplasmic divalent cation tolerance protein